MEDKSSEAHDEFIIHVKIAGETLPLRIRRSEEEVYRQAERLLNTKVDKYARTHATFSRSQILILASYEVAVSLARQNASVDAAPIVAMLNRFSEEIDSVL